MADVLVHQQSFDYALSRAATEVIDWYPSPAAGRPAQQASSSTGGNDTPRSEGGPRSAAAALFRQLPTWHLFISSLGSDTIGEYSSVGKHLIFRYGLYGSVLGSSRGSNTSSFWERIHPLVQLRLSARSIDGSKGVGFRVTMQDVRSIAAVDTMFSFGKKGIIGDEGGRAQNTVSHFMRFDRQLLTNYTIYNVIDNPRSLWLRRGRVGVGVVLRTKLGINIFWGFCVEVLKTLVFLVHIDFLRRTCLSIKAANVFGTGVDAAMRLRINIISFHRTILDWGVAYPVRWRGLGCYLRASVNIGGLSIGGSVDDCTLAQLCGRAGEWASQVREPFWVTKARRYCASQPYVANIAHFSPSGYLLKKSKDPSMQSVKVHITGGVNVRHPMLSTYTNPFSAYQLYTSNANSEPSQQVPKSPGFWDGMRRPSSVHGFFSITFS